MSNSRLLQFLMVLVVAFPTFPATDLRAADTPPEGRCCIWIGDGFDCLDETTETLCLYLEGDWVEAQTCGSGPSCSAIMGRVCDIYPIDDTNYDVDCTVSTYAQFLIDKASGSFTGDNPNFTPFIDCMGTPDCAIGHCCYMNFGRPACEITVLSVCDDRGGSWDSGARHDEVDCDSHGRCCYNNDPEYCAVTDESKCSGPETVWIWGADCDAGSDCEFGHCCFLDEEFYPTCELTLEPFCDLLDGLWDEGMTCDDVECDSHGRCCRFDENGTLLECDITEWVECEPADDYAFWSWLDACDGTYPCDVQGACCFIENNVTVCEQFPEDICAYIQGEWHELVRCFEDPCPTAGVCCYISGDEALCQVSFEPSCDALNGIWSSGGDCNQSPCPPVGACCRISSSTLVCEVTFETDCDGLNGQWSGGVTCTPLPCRTVGACCTIENDVSTCVFDFEDNCLAVGSVFTADVDCSQSPCPNAGACCILNDGVVSCEHRFEPLCEGADHHFVANELCANADCPSTGRCEYYESAGASGQGFVLHCAVTFQEDCSGIDQTWVPGQDCAFRGGAGCVIRVDQHAFDESIPDTGNCWTTCQTTFPELHEALELANAIAASMAPVNVLVAEGVYYPAPTTDPAGPTFRLAPGVRVYGGFAGSTWQGAECDERKPDVFRTILSGDILGNDNGDDFEAGANYSDNSRHVVTCDSTSVGPYTLLDGLYIQAGMATGAATTSEARGGGILVDCMHDVRLNNVVIRNSYAAESGGGVSLESGNLYVDACRFEHNRAAVGGALALPMSSSANAKLYARLSLFESNSAFDAGGAFSGIGDGDAHFMNCVFRHNVAKTDGNGDETGDGGAIIAQSNGGTSTLTFGNCLFHHNYAVGGTAEPDGSLALSADLGRGGAIFLDNVLADIRSCTITRNRSSAAHATYDLSEVHQRYRAAGLRIQSASGQGPVTITNSLFTRNVGHDPNTGAELEGLTSFATNLDCNGGVQGCFNGPPPMVEMSYSAVAAGFDHAEDPPMGLGNLDPVSVAAVEPFLNSSDIEYSFRVHGGTPMYGAASVAAAPVVYGSWGGEWVADAAIPDAIGGLPRLALVDTNSSSTEAYWIPVSDIGAFQNGVTCCGLGDCVFALDALDCYQNLIGTEGSHVQEESGSCDDIVDRNWMSFEDHASAISSQFPEYNRCFNCIASASGACYSTALSISGHLECDGNGVDCESCFYVVDDSADPLFPYAECLGDGGGRIPKLCLDANAYLRASVCDQDVIVDICFVSDPSDPSVLADDRVYLKASYYTPSGELVLATKRVITPDFVDGNTPDIKLDTSRLGRYFLVVDVADAARGEEFADDPDQRAVFSYEVTYPGSDSTVPCDEYLFPQPCVDAGASRTADCNGNGVFDYIEILADETLDQDLDCQIDLCQGVCPTVHLVFIVDTSSSMTSEAGGLCEAIEGLLSDLETEDGYEVHATIMSVTPDDHTGDEFGIGGFLDTCGGLSAFSIDAQTRYQGMTIEGNCCGATVPAAEHLAPGVDPALPLQDWGLASIFVARDDDDDNDDGVIELGEEETIWDPSATLKIIVPISDDWPCGGGLVFRECACSAISEHLPPYGFSCTQVDDSYVGAQWGVEDEALMPHLSVSEMLVRVAKENNVIVSPIVSPSWPLEEPVDWNSCRARIDLADTCLLRLATGIANETGGIATLFRDPAYFDGAQNQDIITNVRRIIQGACSSFTCNLASVISVVDVGLETPIGESLSVIDCQTITLSAASSTTSESLVSAEWDEGNNGVIDHTGIEWRNLSVDNLLATHGEGPLSIRLRVTDSAGCQDESTVILELSNPGPAVGVTGPVSLRFGEAGVFTATASTFCDDVTSVAWSFDLTDVDGNPIGSPTPIAAPSTWPAGAEIAASFEASGRLMVAITDSDGDSAEAWMHVTVLGSGEVEEFRIQDTGLYVEAENHSYEIDGAFVVHSAELILTNGSPFRLHGEIYVAFDGLAPASAELVDDESTNGSPIVNSPNILFLSAAEFLDAGASTDRKVVQWRIPMNESAGPFGYDAVPYLRQEAPIIVSDPTDGVVSAETGIDFEVSVREGYAYFYDVDAYDLDGDPLHYGLSASSEVPQGMGIDPQTGELGWTPHEGACPAGCTVVIQVSDGYEVAEQTVKFVVGSVNLPPVFTTLYETVDLSDAEAGDLSLTIGTIDPDGDSITISANVAEFVFVPSDSIASGGAATLEWDGPSPLGLGLHPVVVTADDGLGGITNQTLYFRVESEPCGQNVVRPQIDSIALPQQAIQGEEYSLQVELSPSDANAVMIMERAPEGMEIDASGLITWTPPFDSNPFEVVTIVASRTDLGESCRDTYSFNLQIEDRNAPPTASTDIVQTTTEGALFRYQIMATDADGDALRYQFDMSSQVPDGMRLSPSGGAISWPVPQTAVRDNGEEFLVRVFVTDAAQASVQVAINMSVQEVNVAPDIRSNPPGNVYEIPPQNPGDPAVFEYVYEIDVVDPDDAGGCDPGDASIVNDGLCYELITNPTAMSMAIEGDKVVLRWVPTPDELTIDPHHVEILVSDGHDTDPQATPQSWDIHAYPLDPSLINHSPDIEFDPVPPVLASHLAEFVAEFSVTDPDGDIIDTTDVTLNPAGTNAIELDDNGSGNWTVTWAPETEDLQGGSSYLYSLTVVAVDSGGAESTSSVYFTLMDCNVGGLPNLLEVLTPPNTEAVADRRYVHEFDVKNHMASSACNLGDPGVSAQVVSPSGMTWENITPIDAVPSMSRIRLVWDTPTAVDVGAPVPVEITLSSASLGTETVTHAFDLNVSAAPENLGPRIRSQPTMATLVDSPTPYRYELIAHDPDHSPVELTWDWEALSDLVGMPTPDVTQASYDSKAFFSWSPTEIGTYRFRISVTDGEFIDSQEFDLEVTDSLVGIDENPPRIEIQTDLDQVSSGAGDTVDITIDVADDFPFPENSTVAIVVKRYYEGVETPITTLSDPNPILVVSPAGQEIGANPMQATSTLTIEGGMPGAYRIEATVVDAGTNSSTAVANVASNPGGCSDPTSFCLDLEITEILNESQTVVAASIGVPEVKGPITVRGHCFENTPDQFYRYELGYRPIGRSDLAPVIVYSSYNKVEMTGDLGEIDPTTMVNGTYDIVLTAFNLNGDSRSVSETIIVSGDRKVGNFTVAFTDMQVPVRGFPAQITRVYDSRKKSMDGDFGFGWDLGIASMTIQESYPIGYDWGLSVSGIGFCNYQEIGHHVVSVNWPDGRVDSFRPQLMGTGGNGNQGSGSSECLFYDLDSLNPVEFVRLSRGSTKLRPWGVLPQIVAAGTDDPTLSNNGVLSTTLLDVNGEVTAWKPRGYEVETQDGTIYTFTSDYDFNFPDAPGNTLGTYHLSSIEDPNGNRITFADDGIKNGDDEYIIRIERDDAGRIRRAIDPEEHAIGYNYDADGNLSSVVDRLENETQFFYDADHALVEIIDPRGVSAARNDYDDQGRLITVTDTDGNKTQFCRDTHTDAADGCYPPSDMANFDNPSNYDLLVFDPNPTEPHDWVDYELVIDPTGLGSLHLYDGNGNVVVSAVVSDFTDPDTGVHVKTIESLTRTSYDPQGRELRTTDAIGNVSEVVYLNDDADLVTEQRSGGRLDENGNFVDYKVSRMAYNDHGQVTITRDPLNVIADDAVTGEDDENVRPSAQFFYNPQNGNLTASKDASGRETLHNYFSDGLLRSVRGPDQKLTQYTYFPDGNVRTQTDAEGNVVEFEYDLNGRRTAERRTVTVVDENGSEQAVELVSTTEYDPAGNVIRQTDPYNNVTTMTYNSINKQETVTDARGNVTQYYYDTRGNIDHVFYHDLTTESYTYDVKGRQLTHTNRDGHTTTTVYDAAGRATTYAPDDTSGDTSDDVFTETENDEGGRTLTVYAPREKSATERFAVTRYFYPRMTFTEVGAFPNCPQLDPNNTIPENQQWVVNYVREYDGDGSGTGEPTKTENAYLSVSYFDLNGRVIKTIDARSIESGDGTYTEFLYNTDGQQTDVIFHDVGGVTRRTTVVYDDLGRKKASIDLAENRTDYVYDESGRLWKIINAMTGVTEYRYDQNGNRVLQIDAEGRETQMVYNERGQMIRRLLPPTDGPGTSAVESWTYDEFGNQETHTDFNGEITAFEYDQDGRLAAKLRPSQPTRFTVLDYGVAPSTIVAECEMLFSGDRRILDISCSHQLGVETQGTLHFYDPNEPSLPPNYIADPAGEGMLHLSASLSDEEQAIFETSLTFFVITEPDETQHWSIITAPDLNPVYYSYTNSGQTSYAGSPNELKGYARSYNVRGQLETEITAELGDAIEYQYDIAGNRTRLETTSEANLSVAYEYDEQNRLIRTTEDPDGVPKHTYYGYDANGNRAWVRNANGTYTQYVYDTQNRLTNLYNFNADNVRISWFEYVLGPAGNRTKVIEHDNLNSESQPRTVDYKYDDLYRLTEEKITNDPDGGNGITSYVYDDVGNRLEKRSSRPGEVALTTYTYNDRDQLMLETMSETVARIRLFDDGTRYARGPPDGDQYASSHGSGYRRPRPSKWSGWIVAGFISHSVMALLFPLSLLRDRRRARRVGNLHLAESRKSRRRRIWHGTISLFCMPLMLIGADTIYALDHDAALYRSIVAISATGPVACEGAASCIEYEWDANGNMLTRTKLFGAVVQDVDTHRYDYENRLIHVERNIDVPTEQVADYRYGPDGIRRWKGSGTSETRYLIDRNQPYAQVLEEVRTDPEALIETKVITTYVYGDDLLSRARTADEEVDIGGGQTEIQSVTHRRYFHYDGQLSTRHLTDEGGGATPEITDEYTYDAFGVMLHKEGLTPAGESENAYLYTGEQYDALAGMYYLRARYYAQQQGRFATTDPFGGFSSDPMSLHKYLYANANSVMNTDPSGLFTLLGINFTAAKISLLFSVLSGVIAGAFEYARTKSLVSAVLKGLFVGTLTFALLRAPWWFAAAFTGYNLGTIEHSEVPNPTPANELDFAEQVVFLVLGALFLLANSRSSPQGRSSIQSAGQLKALLQSELRSSIRRLDDGVSLNPHRNAKWSKARATNNRSAMGSLIHAEMADALRAQQLTNVRVEVSFDKDGQIVRYGAKDSTRIDAQQVNGSGDVLMNFDYKPSDFMNPNQAARIFQRTGSNVEILNYANELLANQ